MRRLPLVLAILGALTAGCEGTRQPASGASAAASAPPHGGAPTSGANDEPPQTTPAPPPAIAAPPGQPGSRAPTPTTVVVVPLTGVATAEDGHGATIPARDPVGIEVRGHVGGQAMGPVLTVGQLRFVQHDYPDAGVVRFVCADRALLPVGAEVALVYGTRRIVVTTSLEVP